jgi:hypothetical protein
MAISAIEIANSDVTVGGLEDGLNLELRVSQPLAGGPKPGDTLLEESECGVQINIVCLELTDDLFQPSQLVCK